MVAVRWRSCSAIDGIWAMPRRQRLRLELEARPRAQVWVRKCRGGAVPAQPVALSYAALH